MCIYKIEEITEISRMETSGTVKCFAFYFAIKRQILQYFTKFIKIHT